MADSSISLLNVPRRNGLAHKLTVLIPVYNTEHRLANCLESLVCQTCDEFTLFLSDNFSTDSSLEIVDRYKDKFADLRIFCQDNNIGGQHNFLFLLRQVRSEFFMFLDSEDEVSPSFVEGFYAALHSHQGNSSMFIPRFHELGSNLKSRDLKITERLASFPSGSRFLTSLNSCSFEGIGHLVYSVFKVSDTLEAWYRVLASKPAFIDISAAWYFLYKFRDVGFIDASLCHYSRHFSVTETRALLNNEFICEQYGHLSVDTALGAINQYLQFCKCDLSADEFERLSGAVEGFFSTKFSFIHSFQSLRSQLGLSPLLV